MLDSLVPKEVDVQTTESKWYRLHIQPYRTLDNVIEGAVITFMNINEIVQAREELRNTRALSRLAVVVRDASDAIILQDRNGRILAWNPAAVKLYGWSEAEALAMNTHDLIPAKIREEELSRIHQLSQAEILKPFRTQRITKSGAIINIWVSSTALVNKAGQMYAIATTERCQSIND